MEGRIHLLRQYKMHHLLVWGSLFFGWYYFRFQDYPAGTAWWITLVKTGDLALLVYTTNYLLIPRLLYKKKYFLFCLVFIAFIFSFSLCKMYVEELLMHYPGRFSIWSNFKARVYDNVLPHFLLVSTGAAIKLMMDYARAQKRLVEISRERSEAELNFLKSQINPHLLFNSLNSIYFLIDKENRAARTTLLQFSDLLRYQLYDCNADLVPVEKELTYLQDYITLQQLRKDQQYDIRMETDPGIGGFYITPLLLIPFVENAFKHISHHSDQRNFVWVALRRGKDLLHFTVENSREYRQETAGPSGGIGTGGIGTGGIGSGGIGLNNVRRRLQLLYPDRHELTIDDNGAIFKVSLNLQIP